MVLRYKSPEIAQNVAVKLKAQGATLRGTKLLVPFRAVARRDTVLIVFTETPLQDECREIIDSVKPEWIDGR